MNSRYHQRCVSAWFPPFYRRDTAALWRHHPTYPFRYSFPPSREWGPASGDPKADYCSGCNVTMRTA